MNNSVNLITSKQSESEKTKKRLSLLRKIAYGSLISVGTLSVVIFILNNAISTSSIKRDQSDTISKIAVLSERSGNYLLLQDRLKNISSLDTKRRKYSKLIDFILKDIPASLVISNFGFMDNSFSITTVSPSLLAHDAFLERLTTSASKKQIIDSLQIDSLIADEKNGKVTISIKGTIP